ncbi:MAG: hypothetical protein AAF197_01425 [Pseudomonadota bacterium]
MKSTIYSLLLVVVVLFGGKPAFASTFTSLLWIERNEGMFEIWQTMLEEEDWLDPHLVHQTPNEVSTPALVLTEQGNQLMVWSEWLKNKSVLKSQTVFTETNTETAANTIFSSGLDNISPNLLKDANGELWLFWCHDNGQQSDIYVMQADAKASWSSPYRVHEANKVPDLNPLAVMNSSGNIEVTWLTYNLDNAAYQNTVKEIELNQELTENQRQSDDYFSKLLLPNFISQEFPVYAYRSGNLLQQNRVLGRATGN